MSLFIVGMQIEITALCSKCWRGWVFSVCEAPRHHGTKWKVAPKTPSDDIITGDVNWWQNTLKQTASAGGHRGLDRKHYVVPALSTGLTSNYLGLCKFIAQHVHIVYACYCLLVIYLKTNPPAIKRRTYTVMGKQLLPLPKALLVVWYV